MMSMTSCSLLSDNINIDNNNKTSCYYPKFPTANKKVKDTLKSLNNRDIDLYIKELVVYKLKIENLKGKRYEQ